VVGGGESGAGADVDDAAAAGDAGAAPRVEHRASPDKMLEPGARSRRRRSPARSRVRPFTRA
jgi:hypothetical protein